MSGTPTEINESGNNVVDSPVSLITGPDEITINGTSKTLAKMGITLNSATTVITLISRDMSLISWAKGGTAIAGINSMPNLEMFTINIYSEEAASLEFVTDGDEVKASIMQEG